MQKISYSDLDTETKKLTDAFIMDIFADCRKYEQEFNLNPTNNFNTTLNLVKKVIDKIEIELKSKAS